MTNKKLKRLYYLNRDISRIQNRIDELEAAAESTTATITGLPGGTTVSDKVGNISVQLVAERMRLEAAKLDAIVEYAELTDYIESINDPLMRQIMQYRHVNGLEWEQIAEMIGGGITGESCRVMHWRFLGKQ